MSLALQLDPHPGANNIHVAWEYADAGIPVFPCREVAWCEADGKIIMAVKSPYTSSGFKDATTDKAQLREWWKSHPYALVGIPCGAANIFAVDCDVKNKDVDGNKIDGIKNYIAIAGAIGIDLNLAATVRTPADGKHNIYVMPDGEMPRNTTDVETGIDTRGNGGYVIAAGTVMPDGTRYEAIGPDLITMKHNGTLPVLPLALLAAVQPQKAAGKALDAPTARPVPQPQTTAHPPPSSLPGRRERAVADAALANECAAVASCPSGGRNDRLNTAAHSLGTMIGCGWIDRTTVEGALSAAAFQSGLAAAETARTLKSAIDVGIAKPRDPLSANDPPLVDGVATIGPNMAAAYAAASPAPPGNGQLAAALPPPPAVFTAKPFTWRDPELLVLPNRIYGDVYCGKIVSATVAQGGAGKSFLHITETLAIATGRDLLGIMPSGKCNVLYYNGEDDSDVLQNRFQAAIQLHGINPTEVEHTLHVNSGIDEPIMTAHVVPGHGLVHTPIIQAIINEILAKEIKVFIVDPFVTTHEANENDNGQIAAVVADWVRVAAKTGCAVMLVHHITKSRGNNSSNANTELTANSARGAGAFGAAVRFMRTMRQLTKAEAAKVGINPAAHKQYVEITIVKSNFSAMDAASHWIELVQVDLTARLKVAAVTKWKWPHVDDASDFDDEQIRAVQQVVSGGDYNLRSNGKNWVGFVIGSIFKLNKLSTGHLTETAEMKRKIIALVKEGWILEAIKYNSEGKRRIMLVVGKLAGVEGLLGM